jgi:short-subunit dehydrogenase
MPGGGIYSASKAAGWQLTNSLRLELQSQGTHVTGLYVGLMDTDMTAGLDMPKSSPDDVAGQTLAGVEAGLHEVLADDTSRTVRAALSSEVTALYPSLT